MTTEQIVSMTIRLPAALHQALRDRVNADRSIQSQIVDAVAKYLKSVKD